MPLRLVTVPGVELARLGTWATSTGIFTFRPEHFAAAVAAQHDPEVFAAPVKIGHIDPRFQAAADAGQLDGDPALGWVRNIRTQGDRLLGDLVNVPEALAEVMATAYPRRSIELGFDIHTPSGHRYPAAVMGLALLGVSAPAVAGLADVVSLFDGSASFELAAAAAAQVRGSRVTVLCADGLGGPDQVRAYYDLRGALGVLCARPGVPASMAAAAHQLVEDLAGMPAASAPAPGAVGHTPGTPQPYPGGPPMQITDARLRELLGLEANADAEAALVALRDRAAQAPAAATPPAPPVPEPIPGSQPFIPTGYVPAPPAPAAPAGYAAPPAAGAPPAGYVPATPGLPGVPAPAPAPLAAPAPAAAPPAPAPAPVATGDLGQQIAAAVAAAVQPMLAAAAAPGMQVAETLRLRDRESVMAAHCSRGAVRPADLGYWRTAYDANPVGTIAHMSGLPAVFPTFELGQDQGPGATGDPAAVAAQDQAFLASLGIAN